MKVVACQCSVCLFSSLPDPGLVSNGPQCTGAGDSFPKFSTPRECTGLPEEHNNELRGEFRLVIMNIDHSPSISCKD